MEKSVFGSSISTSVHTVVNRNLHRFIGIEDRRFGNFSLGCADTKSFNTFGCSSQIQFLRNYRHLASTYHHFGIGFSKSSSSSQRGECQSFDSSGSFVKVIDHRQKASATYFLLKQAIKTVIILLSNSLCAPSAFAAFEAATGVGVQRMGTSGWMGFVAGCLHTLSGPDHLAALAPLSIGRTHMESVVVGALWGCGHDAGQLIFGLLFLLVKDRLHIEVIRTWGTRVVGLTLVVIGVMGVREASENIHPCVPLEKKVLENGTCGSNPAPKRKMGFATFATGIVHGLQPDSLLIILPALALPSRWDGATFLVMFLLGTVVAMGGYTLLLTSCSRALKDRIPKITEKMTWVSSVLAIALGSAIFVGPFFGFGIY